MIKVTDNFLSPDQHRRISNFLLGTGMDWKFNESKVSTQTKKSIDDYQFTHVFFTFHSCTGKAVHEVSKSIDILIPLVNNIQFVALHRIKANLEPLKPNRAYSDFHCDVDCSTMTTGICLLYTSPSPRDRTRSRMPSSA